MNRELIQEHIKEKTMQGFTDKKYDTYFDGKVLQVCFYSKGCKFSCNGNCIMCDYGKTRKENLTPNDIKEIVQEVFKTMQQLPKVLLLNSLGSVLDETEMPKENIIVLLDEITKVDIDIVIFETHYTTISKEILELIKAKLENKRVTIELGFESSNSEYRKNYLNKIIDNDKFIEKVNLIKSYGFSAETNVIFGMPFISTQEQIKDTIRSIRWCFENNVDRVNLFPINIKPYTLLYKLYEMGEYSPVKHKDFINVLSQIPEEDIEKIYLCWYGNREIKYDKKETILPVCEGYDNDKLMDFYMNFNLHKDREFRKRLIETFAKNSKINQSESARKSRKKLESDLSMCGRLKGIELGEGKEKTKKNEKIEKDIANKEGWLL